jgi:hypothetical protein
VLEYGGIPRLRQPERARDGRHFVRVAENATSWCPDFSAYVAEAFGEDSTLGIGEAPVVRRFLPVTAETCRLLLDGHYRDALFYGGLLQ